MKELLKEIRKLDEDLHLENVMLTTFGSKVGIYTERNMSFWGMIIAHHREEMRHFCHFRRKVLVRQEKTVTTLSKYVSLECVISVIVPIVATLARLARGQTFAQTF